MIVIYTAHIFKRIVVTAFICIINVITCLGLTVTVSRPPMDEEKYEKVKLSIRERYKILKETPMGYAAQMGDVVTANMRGYELNDDGSKGLSAFLPFSS